MGLWLRDHVRPGDRVFLETIGYIGYASGARLDDYPGLTSPEIVAARRRGLGFYDLIAERLPAWVVLRDAEAAGMAATRPDLLARYALVRRFDDPEGHKGGDFTFFILARRGPGGPLGR